ncbi:unnamed protein product [Sphenostylis stenocarpa]|uniref:Uncharacterized protein n=1 Tax=Sphenostylis stenocarpa TaxID=92480 RepID=A0AA86VXT7_9FABA|nr:unnamed protein product [Sphenostylis stenocarpa]
MRGNKNFVMHKKKEEGRKQLLNGTSHTKFEVRTAVLNASNSPSGVLKLVPRLVGQAEHSRNKFNLSLFGEASKYLQ